MLANVDRLTSHLKPGEPSADLGGCLTKTMTRIDQLQAEVYRLTQPPPQPAASEAALLREFWQWLVLESSYGWIGPATVQLMVPKGSVESGLIDAFLAARAAAGGRDNG